MSVPFARVPRSGGSSATTPSAAASGRRSSDDSYNVDSLSDRRGHWACDLHDLCGCAEGSLEAVD
eukprot:10347359-Lingulodinium_polyedra.AAC.1